jgi:hypothetical protein
MKVNVIGLGRLSLHKLNHLKNNYEDYKHLPITDQYYRQVVEMIKRKERYTMKQRIDDALVWMHTNGLTKAHLVGSLWLIIVNDDYAHVTMNGNVLGKVKI